MKELKAKVAVVTGAASGIGLALCQRFAARGMKIAMADIEQAALEGAVEQLEEAGADALGVRCDVRDPASVESLRDQTLEHFGSVHVICNNAGVAPAGPILDTTPADWKWITDVNILGVAYGVTTFGPLLTEQGEGHIVNTASEAGLVTNTALGMYCATKHAVVGMSEALYRELEATNVGVSVLCPNLVNTKIFESERNRDDGLDAKPSQVAAIAPLREAIGPMGIPTTTVADRVVDAIENDRFWIFTHGFTPGAAGKRFADIEAGRNPTDPYEGIDFGM